MVFRRVMIMVAVMTTRWARASSDVNYCESTTYIETKQEIQQDRFWKQNTTLSSGLVSVPIPDVPGSSPDVLSLSTYMLSPNPDIRSPNPDVPSPKPTWAWAHMGPDPHWPTHKQTHTEGNAHTQTHTHTFTHMGPHTHA